MAELTIEEVGTLTTAALMQRMTRKSEVPMVRVDIARPGIFHLMAYCQAEGVALQITHAGSLFADGYMSPAGLALVQEAGFGVKRYQ